MGPGPEATGRGGQQGLQRTPWPSWAPSLMLFACLCLGFLICAMQAAPDPHRRDTVEQS